MRRYAAACDLAKPSQEEATDARPNTTQALDIIKTLLAL
jgi:hypothetical protein